MVIITNDKNKGIAINNSTFLERADIENWRAIFAKTKINKKPISKFRIFVASSDSKLIRSNGTSSQLNNGLQ